MQHHGTKRVVSHPAIWHDVENGGNPRDRFWDALLVSTDAGGVHFQDTAALQGFELPEWSHLRAEHAVEFTNAQVLLVEEVLKTRQGVKDPDEQI